MGSTHRWRLFWWLWFAALFALSSVPGDRLGPRPFDWFDKIEHAGFFFLGGLILGGWQVAAGRWPSRWWLLPLAAALVGAFDEVHQLFTPGRSGLDPGDWAADILGGTAALAAMPWLARWIRGREARHAGAAVLNPPSPAPRDGH